MRRILLAVAVALGMLVLTPTPSWACSCAMASMTQHVRQAVTVAAGKVEWSSTDGQTRTYKVDFDAVYKGAAASSEKVTTDAHDASCGLGDLAVGKRYLFFVDGRHPGTMQVGLCGGTTAYTPALAQQVENVTGPPGKPVSVPGDASRADGGGGSNHGRLLGLGVLAVLVGVGVAARRAVRR